MKIKPIHSLRGNLFSSPSKSYSHRAFALATTADSISFIINPLFKGDVSMTIDFCSAFGANVKRISYEECMGNEMLKELITSQDIVFKIEPPKEFIAPKDPIDARNSGTSIRIMAALASLCKGDTSIIGTFFKRQRPIEPLLNSLKQIGIASEVITDKGEPIGIKISPKNRPKAGLITIPGDVSSQFITALMFLAPNLLICKNKSEEGEEVITKIKLTSPAKSYPYLKISEHILSDFNIRFSADFSDDLYGVYSFPPEQKYSGQIYRIPGDFSSMAFPIVAAALNPFPDEVTIFNLDFDSPQGDKQIIFLLQNIGADIEIDKENKSLTIRGGKPLQGFKIDCSQTPDLFPILCVLGLYCENETKIYNAGHVRIKETDRISIMVRELRKMGAVIDEFEDGVIFKGPQMLNGCHIEHENDHRIAMAMIIAALYARSDSTIDRPEIVEDSYPTFYEDMKKLGAQFI